MVSTEKPPHKMHSHYPRADGPKANRIPPTQIQHVAQWIICCCPIVIRHWSDICRYVHICVRPPDIKRHTALNISHPPTRGPYYYYCKLCKCIYRKQLSIGQKATCCAFCGRTDASSTTRKSDFYTLASMHVLYCANAICVCRADLDMRPHMLIQVIKPKTKTQIVMFRCRCRILWQINVKM